ncbi:MAG: T9SS type A sorting domain-containing protein [candidate division WOR-3 bacterium]
MVWLLISLFMSYEYKSSWFVRGIYGWDFAIKDSLLFATSGYGVDIINFANPTSPTLVSNIMTPGWPYGVEVNNNLLCVCDDYAGVKIYDISNPALPMELGHIDSPGSATMIVIRDTFAYLADDWCGLRIINISNPYNPVEIGSYDTPGRAIWLDVADTLAYISDYYNGLLILNVREPSNPQFVGQWQNPNLSYIWAVDVIDTLLYVTGQYLVVPQLKHFMVLNVSNPTTPSYVYGITFPEPPDGMVIRDTIAFVCDQTSGIRIVNIANPFNMFEITHIPGFYYNNLTAHNPLLFTANSTYGNLNDHCIKIFDISNFNNITPIGQYNPGPFIEDVCLEANTLFVLAVKEYANIMAFSCVVPESLTFIDSLILPSGSRGCLVYEPPYLYVGHGDRLSILKFNNNAFQHIVSLNSPVDAVVPQNTFLFTGTEVLPYGFRSYNITNPFLPQLIDSLPIRCTDMAIVDRFAYVAYGNKLYVVNIENPYNLFVACSLNTGQYSQKIVKYQSYLIIGNQNWCLQIVDISQPTNPQIIDTISTPQSYNYDIVINDSLLFVATGDKRGVLVYNITNPVIPVLVDSCDTPGFAQNIAVGDDYLFVADWLCLGLIKRNSTAIAEYYANATKKKFKIYPNLFSDCLNIEIISSQKQSHVVLNVYDALGRLVRNINGVSIGAMPSIIWDGRDGAKRPVPPGVYFIQIMNSEDRKTIINKVVKIN